jgi:cytidylate kinase
MTDDQFKQLLEQNNDALIKQFDRRFNERLAQINAQLLANIDERIDIRLNEHLEQSNAVLFGQMTQYFDKRFDTLQAKLKADTSRFYNLVDGLSQRLTTDEQERVAINEEQKRQNGWIAQLAEATNTKLMPEQ